MLNAGINALLLFIELTKTQKATAGLKPFTTFSTIDYHDSIWLYLARKAAVGWRLIKHHDYDLNRLGHRQIRTNAWGND